MEKILNVLSARQTVGAWARKAMLAACLGIMVGMNGVASADYTADNHIGKDENAYFDNGTRTNGIITLFNDLGDNIYVQGSLDKNTNIELATGASSNTVKIGNNNSDTLTVGAKATFNDTLEVKGNTTLGGTLGVTGTITAQGLIKGKGFDADTNKIVNVVAGDITADSKDAVNGGQLYTLTNVATAGNYISTGTDVAGNLGNLDTAIGTWDAGNNIVAYDATNAAETSVGANLGKLDTAIGNLENNKNGNVITEQETAAAQIGALDEKLGKFTDGNYTQEKGTVAENISALDTQVKLNADKINKINDRVDRVGATAAALAGIHYQPMAKGQSQVAVGMGGYKGKKATALGMAYQFSDRVSGSIAGSANGSERMFNVGFNYLFGQHSAKDVAQMAAAPGSVSLKEAELQAKVDSQNAKINNLEAEIAELRAMVKALAAK